MGVRSFRGGLFLSALIAAASVLYFNRFLRSDFPVHVDGIVSDGFEDVRVAFLKNFADGWEREGASFAVFRDGVKVVDLWGGFADRQSARKWKQDTLTVGFSTTKAVAALCVALLVDRRLLSYEDPIVKFWPEFGRNGKENITVQMALSHQAGLAWFDTTITEDLAADAEKMRAVIEEERPKWPPGTAVGYHAYTFGWLVDHIVRSVDPQKRSIGTFFREEIADKYGVDFHIGLRREEHFRVARVSVPPMAERVDEVMYDWRVIRYFRALWDLMDKSGPLSRVVENPSWLQAVLSCTVNNPDYQSLEQAAALGIGNARALARVFDLAGSGGLLSGAALSALAKPVVDEADFIFRDRTPKGNGLLFFPLNRAQSPVAFGHTGHGCQHVQYDPVNKISIAYMSNGLKTGLGPLCRTLNRLQDAVYDAVERSQRSS